MSKIEIETCSQTPNYDALEAVARSMMEGYQTRTHKKEREMTVSTGRVLKVVELDKPGDGVCDCKYSVTFVKHEAR